MKNLIWSVMVMLVFVLGCADFFNSTKSSSGSKGRTQVLDSNPFPKGFDPNEGEFATSKMLANIGLNVIAPKVASFRLQSELMGLQVRNYCQALETQQNVEGEKLNTQNQWKKAMLAYDAVAAMPVGPLTDNKLELSNEIYSWPSIHICGVDRAVAELALDGGYEELLYTSKGLAALEYLFFEPTQGSVCILDARANAKVAEWLKRTAEQRTIDRCNMGKIISAELLTAAKQLEKAWDPDLGNFSKVMIDGTRYESVKKAVNAMSDALFSLEDNKDIRLARPLGFKDCLRDIGKCPEMAEHPWSGLAFSSLAARTKSANEAFQGGSGFGFDDYLAQVGHPEVNLTMIDGMKAVASALDQADAGGTLQQQIEAMNNTLCRSTRSDSRLVEVCAIHQDLKSIVVELKADFLSVLSLEAPASHSGDAD